MNPREDLKICNFLPAEGGKDVIHGAVAQCNSYHPKNLPTIASMEQIAWQLTSDKKSGKIGFIAPAERKKRGMMPNRFEYEDD